jgi:hypothetical protein
VLYVPELKKNLLLVSVLEDDVFAILFQKGQVLIHSERDSPDTTVSIGVREGKVYKFQGMPVQVSKGILDHGSMSVADDKEHEALKGDESSQTSSSCSQLSRGKEELALSNYVRRPSSYELTLMDA